MALFCIKTGAELTDMVCRDCEKRFATKGRLCRDCADRSRAEQSYQIGQAVEGRVVVQGRPGERS